MQVVRWEFPDTFVLGLEDMGFFDCVAAGLRGRQLRSGRQSFGEVMKDHEYFAYIVCSRSGTLYIGMTNSIYRRALEHKRGEVEGFASKYHCDRLVYFESFDDVHKAIGREKQLKGWTRAKKIALIESRNPRWQDLAETWGAQMAFAGESVRMTGFCLENCAAQRIAAATNGIKTGGTDVDFQVNGETYFLSLAENERQWVVLVATAEGARPVPVYVDGADSEDLTVVVEDKERRRIVN